MESPFEPQLVDVDDELLADVVQQGLFAADDAILNRGPHRTHADETRAAVAAAFRLAARNGLITLAPRESWPEWIALDAGREGS
jgi:Arc/MetJ family transcription regulator